MAHGCEKQVLAKTNVCIVERCSCGSVHVTIGPVTLRLDEQTLGDAARALHTAVHHAHEHTHPREERSLLC